MITVFTLKKICKSSNELREEVCNLILEKFDGQKETYEKNDVVVFYSSDESKIIAFVKFIGHFDINLVAYRESLVKLQSVVFKWFGYNQGNIVSFGIDFMELCRNVNGLIPRPLVGDFEGLIQFNNFSELVEFENVLHLVNISSLNVITMNQLIASNRVAYVNILPGRKMIIKTGYTNKLTAVGQPLLAHSIGEVLYEHLNFIDPEDYVEELPNEENFTEEEINKWFGL